MDIRLRRLEADFKLIRALLYDHPEVKVLSVTGNPPERYKLMLTVKSLRQGGEQISLVTDHTLEIRMPLGYPRDPPVCRMLTPVFHPNIAPHAICIGDYWSAGESLDELIMRVCEMLAFQSYNIKSPLNGDAARWMEGNMDMIPLDTRTFQVKEKEESVDLQASTSHCSNCGQEVGAPITHCDHGHVLCNDCLETCRTCGRVLCLTCGTLSCLVCDQH